MYSPPCALQLKLGVYYKGALVAPGQSPTTAAGWLEYLNFFLTGNPYYDKVSR